MKIKVLFPLMLFCIIAVASAEKKPNVLLIMIDDLGYTDLGVNGSTFYETPHLDKLAEKGVNFKNSYSGHPVCSPTRAAMMSGKSPQRVGITQWIHQPSDIHLPLSEVTIGEAFQEAGYKTAYMGKWHIGEKENQLPSGQGFEWMQSVNRAGQPGSYFFPYSKKSKRGTFWDVPDFQNGKKGDYLTDAMTDKALSFIEAHKDGEKPFFLFLSHYAVHTPIESPKSLVKKYEKKRKKLYGDSKTPWIKTRYNNNYRFRGRQDHPGYAAMIENLDSNIGRTLKYLDDNGLRENTIVIFTSDNGGHQSLTKNVGLNAGKGWSYEGGIRIPTIISWKGKVKALNTELPIITMDMYPTLLDLAGIPLKPEQHLDGMSFKSELLGQENDKLKKRFLAWSYPHGHGSGHKPSSAMRMGDWKLIHFKKGKPYELYNLKNDQAETNDLSSANPERVKEMAKILANWLKETTVDNSSLTASEKKK